MGDATPDQKAPGISSFAAYAIILNYVIGTGVFALPYAFHRSGQALGVMCTAMGAFASYLSVSYVIESIARTEFLSQNSKVLPAAAADNVEGTDTRNQRLLLDQISETETAETAEAKDILVGGHRQDYVVMCYMYGGGVLRAVCQVVLVLYCLTILWSFTAVFASSVSMFFFKYALDRDCDVQDGAVSSDCKTCYYICIGIFAVIAVSLACLDVAEQATVQMCLTIYRFIAFGVMVVTLIIGYFHTDTWHFKPERVDSWANWSGFVKIFTTSVIGFQFHYNIPDVVQPVREKKDVLIIMRFAFVTIFLFYVTLGSLASVYFGDDVNPIVTLNWSDYNGGWETGKGKTAWWSYVIQMVVNLFPIFDMLSVFPLVAISVGNNVLSSLPDSVHAWCDGHHRGERILKIATRLAVSIPAVFLAALLGKLDQIFEYVAIFAFFLAYIFPCTMQLLSQRMAGKVFPNTLGNTYYTTWYHHPVVVTAVLVFGIIAAILALVGMIV